ncbi:MAG: peptidoglycan-binding domain-containing protein [Polyangia bacterium]
MKKIWSISLGAALLLSGAYSGGAPAMIDPPGSPAAPVDGPLKIFRVEPGKESPIDAVQAQREGLTVVDLTDRWVPYIFRDAPAPAGPNGEPGGMLEARYKSVFLGLANDVADLDGQPIPATEHNYLELYGIPPTLRVLRQRFLDDGAAPDRCADVKFDVLKSVVYIPYREGKTAIKENQKMASAARMLASEVKKRHLATIDDLASDPKLGPAVVLQHKFDAERLAFTEAEKRLACEGFFDKKSKHVTGTFDDALRVAVTRFQRKHKLYDAAAFKKETMAALGRTLLENDYADLVRVLTERVVSAADVLEDGSTDSSTKGPHTYKNDKGEDVAVRNMVDECAKALLAAMDLPTPEKALAFFQHHDSFRDYAVALKLPDRPAYYAPHMDLSVEIDRGDVFYDPPYDDKGKATDQSRHHFPSMTMRVRYNGQLIPLVRWRTTIGGWRSDLASNGYEYYRYKGSDIGPRVWRHIAAGPVWIAPNSTPVRTLVKYKNVAGSSQRVVNYDEVGPGYLSAYGLVAAYNVVPGKDGKPDWDNGVRVHGSSEILSIRNPDAYSHGCHRLMNHLAVRLFSFTLHHRTMTVIGERPLNFSRQFLWKDDIYEMRLPSRGYYFQLEPPLPVNVLEGNILGKQKKPITTYMPMPGITYPPGPMPIPPDSPEARAGGDE